MGCFPILFLSLSELLRGSSFIVIFDGSSKESEFWSSSWRTSEASSVIVASELSLSIALLFSGSVSGEVCENRLLQLRVAMQAISKNIFILEEVKFIGIKGDYFIDKALSIKFYLKIVLKALISEQAFAFYTVTI